MTYITRYINRGRVHNPRRVRTATERYYKSVYPSLVECLRGVLIGCAVGVRSIGISREVVVCAYAKARGRRADK